jgi:hypothetical protein
MAQSVSDSGIGARWRRRKRDAHRHGARGGRSTSGARSPSVEEETSNGCWHSAGMAVSIRNARLMRPFA